jgi:hypothetical protein
MMLGAMYCMMASRMEAFVSPVIKAVGGASPYPAVPSSVTMRIRMLCTASTVRDAVLNGVRSGMATSPISILSIFIIKTPLFTGTLSIRAKAATFYAVLVPPPICIYFTKKNG